MLDYEHFQAKIKKLNYFQTQAALQMFNSQQNFRILLFTTLYLFTLLPVNAELSAEQKQVSTIKENKPAEQEISPLEEIMLQETGPAGKEKILTDIPVLQGSATRIVDKEAKVSVSLMTILSSEFSEAGDEVVAKILVKPGTNSQENSSLAALKGSKILGHVVEVKESRKAGRAGYVKVVFDTLRIKSGKEFPINAELTTESFKGKEAAKLVLYDAKLVTLGALWGTYSSLKWAPLAAIYTNGLSVGLSAGIGASIGLIGAIRRKGEMKTFFPGEKNVIKFQDSLSLDDEALSEALASSKQLNSDVIGLRLELLEVTTNTSDEEYDNLLTVKVKVNNDTLSSIYPCDLLLLPKDGNTPVMADLRKSGMDLLNSIKKGESSIISLSYPIDAKSNLKDYDLALIDPIDKAYLSQVPLDKITSNTIAEHKE